jgi:hypothetical protein
LASKHLSGQHEEYTGGDSDERHGQATLGIFQIFPYPPRLLSSRYVVNTHVPISWQLTGTLQQYKGPVSGFVYQNTTTRQ